MGKRVVDASASGHWQTNTLIQAVDSGGTRAALVLDGPVEGASFAAFCEQLLAPTLRPGDLVILDNLSSHQSAAASAAIEAAGAQMIYLPPYSPDLNPIENIFSKVKQLIRGFRPRNWEGIIDAVREALRQITACDLENAFAHCGYVTT